MIMMMTLIVEFFVSIGRMKCLLLPYNNSKSSNVIARGARGEERIGFLGLGGEGFNRSSPEKKA